jgi:hypothetical protein
VSLKETQQTFLEGVLVREESPCGCFRLARERQLRRMDIEFDSEERFLVSDSVSVKDICTYEHRLEIPNGSILLRSGHARGQEVDLDVPQVEIPLENLAFRSSLAPMLAGSPTATAHLTSPASTAAANIRGTDVDQTLTHDALAPFAHFATDVLKIRVVVHQGA